MFMAVSVCAVVSIRGTLSLEDCVTDFMCEPVDLDDWIKEMDSSQGSKSFSDRVPEVKPASKLIQVDSEGKSALNFST